MYTNILQVCFVQAHSGLHGSLLRADFVSQVSPQLCCSRALIIHNSRTSCSVVHYLHSPYKTESVQAHSVLHGSLLTKKRQSRFPAGSASKIHNMNTPEIYYYRRLLYVRLYEFCKLILINSLCFIPAGLEKWCPQFNALINITYH